VDLVLHQKIQVEGSLDVSDEDSVACDWVGENSIITMVFFLDEVIKHK
jgi:hypothetical protein